MLHFESTDWILFLIVTMTSALSAILGLGGGSLLIAAMAYFTPPSALIPIHGIAQLSSNFSRAYLMREHIAWRIIKKSFVGAILAGIVGSFFVLKVDEKSLLFFLSIGVIVFTWLPSKFRPPQLPMKWYVLGFFITLLSLFVGATGPLSAPFFLDEKLKKEEIIATQAAYQIFTHGSKVFTYIGAGFLLAPYWGLIILLCLGAWLGSLIGRNVHKIIPSEKFILYYKIIITLLALRLIMKGFNF